MTYVVTLDDYTPVERHDGEAWTAALIQESATQDGTFATIETVDPLTPADTDPENPTTRSFTTEFGTIENGWYRIVWKDNANQTTTTPPVQNLGAPRAYRPLVSDVAEAIRTRTTDANGNEQGTFTATTRPTYQQAARVIDGAMRKLEARFGPIVKDELVGSATEVVRLRAAMLIELEFFGDQIRADRSPYNELKALYTEALNDFILEKKELGADDIPGDDDDTSGAGLPVYAFPNDCGWRESRLW